MRKILLLFTLISLTFSLSSVPTNASTFASTYVRLDSQKASSPLSGTICAQPSSAGAGTENKVIVNFPTDFTVSQTASNWTTNTTTLPSGSTDWPGIGSPATSVSGQSVTFSSSDLSLDTLYCFNFTGTSSTTGALGIDKTGTIITKDNLNGTIDSVTYAISITNNNQIGVTASIDPQVSNLPITIESTTTGTTFSQDSTLNYKITYGNNATTSVPLIIQAEWSQGTISGNPSPSVDILDYVVGSASNAYGSTPAVIDTVNRTITWTISSIPASTTGQTATFNLETNSSYTGSSLVSFNVLARATSGSTVTPDETVTKNYQYSAAPSATPTPTSAASVTTTPTSTPTPTPTPAAFSFSEISVRSLSQSKAQIYIETNNKSTFAIDYGTSLNNLSSAIRTASLKRSALITLPDLKLDTAYYFKITATDENDKLITSDIFTFRTPAASEILKVDLQSIVITSSDNIILSPKTKAEITNQQNKNIIVIPASTIFTVKFSLAKNVPLKVAQLIVRNKNVLGFSTIEKADASSNYVNLTEVEPGVYTGKIKSVSTPGTYEVYVRLIDFNGNITEQKISELIVTQKFTILEKNTGNPIENARILLYLYNRTSKVYELISPQSLSIENPSFSKADGTVDLVLIPGKYKADALAIGYNPSSSEFEINFDYGDYPTIYLEKQPFNIFNTFNYYSSTFFDVINESQTYMKQRADSNRLFDLTAFGAIFIFVIVSVLSISARTHIGIFYLPNFLIFKLMILFKKNTGRIIFGKVLEEETKMPISRAIVSLMTVNGTKTLATLKTNKLGEFYYNNPQGQDFKIKIEKEGFEAPLIYNFKNSEVKEIPVFFKLKNKVILQRSLFKIIFVYTEDLLGIAMESLILLGLFAQIYFIYTFGLLRVGPFIILTILNLILIFTYLYKPKGLEA